VFGVILLAILVRGGAIGRVFAVEGAAVPERPGLRVPEILRGSTVLRNGMKCLAGLSLLVAVVFPLLPYFRSNQFLLVLVLVYALVGVSLTILVGWAGQVSLGQFAMVGIAAFFTARWAGETGWSVIGLVVAAGLIGSAVMIVIGLPALRVRGLTLAVSTLGLAVVAPDWLYQQSWLGGSTPFADPVQISTIFPGFGQIGSQLNLYYVVLAVLVIMMAAAATLRRSAAGRVIIAVRDNERASAAFGITPAVVKLRVLALSGFIAATAGVFWALAWQSLNPTQFPADVSIAVLAIPVIGGLGSLGGAVAAAVLLYMGTFFIGPHVSSLLGSFGQNVGFLLFVSGIGVILAMQVFPNGLAGKAQDLWQAFLNRKAAKLEAKASSMSLETGGPASVLADDSSVADSKMPALHATADIRLGTFANPDRNGRERKGAGAEPVEGAWPLVVKDLTVHFGGIAALSGAEIAVGPGEIVGLIGPNGAGKTTLMNAISGVLRPDHGSVQLFGHDVAARSPEVRARHGVARSFQDASLFAGLTVSETIQVAMLQGAKTRILPAMVGAPWTRAAERASRQRSLDIVNAFGLAPWADALTSELSTGMRRICDLAAQVTTEPRLLLLDEPTAGVAQREAEAFGPLVRRIRDDLDCSVLIIEHDMPMLMGLCDRVYAFEAGYLIAEGTPTQVRDNPEVIASYLGTDATAINRSGQHSVV
jgi:ABC-type branched-subunit amino acid transport system ATPase component/ABC-type branched-subunit amino acid transport system permease subunit